MPAPTSAHRPLTIRVMSLRLAAARKPLANGQRGRQNILSSGVDPDYTATIGLSCDQARALVAAADADRGPQALRTAPVIRLLVHNALRVDEACAADVADLGADAGALPRRVDPLAARRVAGPR